MAVEIGKQYQGTLEKAVALYKHGIFEEESKRIEKGNGLFNPIGCYLCHKRIEEKHILIRENDGKSEEKLRFHTKCIEEKVGSL